MIRGVYISASGMVAETTRTDTIANNIANSNTAGYKRDIAVNKDFAEMLIWRINDGEKTPNIGGMGIGTIIDEIGTDHQQAGTRQTGNPFNLAIEGEGYFAVQTPNGTRYTRDGTFTLNSVGEMVTMNGNLVLDQNGGAIQLDVQGDAAAPAKMVVDSTGRVMVDGVEAGTLMLTSFADERQLMKQGNNLFNAENALGGQQPFTGRVIQGYLEMSNANVISDMVNLIATYRAYEVNAKAVQSHDHLMGKAVTEVGKV